MTGLNSPASLSAKSGNLPIFVLRPLSSINICAISAVVVWRSLATIQAFPQAFSVSAALAAEGYEKLANLLEDNEERLTMDKKTMIGRIYKMYGEFALASPELYRLMFSRLGNSLHSERCRTNARRAFGVLIRLGERMNSGGGDLRPLVLSLYAGLHGWAMILLDDLIPPETGVNSENWQEFALPPRI